MHFKGECAKHTSGEPSTRNCSAKYNFLPSSTIDWDIPCSSESDCPRGWFCSTRCYAPSSNPSGSSDNSLYVPIISGLGYSSLSCIHCNHTAFCPPTLPCSDGRRCSRPLCSGGGISHCWCDLFASRIRKPESCLRLRSCPSLQREIERARKLSAGEIKAEFKKIIRNKRCKMENGEKGYLCL